MVSGANEGIDRRLCRVLCIIANLGGLWNHFKFEKESRAFARTKGHPGVGILEGNRSARTALL